MLSVLTVDDSWENWLGRPSKYSAQPLLAMLPPQLYVEPSAEIFSWRYASVCENSPPSLIRCAPRERVKLSLNSSTHGVTSKYVLPLVPKYPAILPNRVLTTYFGSDGTVWTPANWNRNPGATPALPGYWAGSIGLPLRWK